MNFIDRLKEFRVTLDLTKRDLAEKLSVSEGYYNLIESGKRNPSKAFLYKLVDYSNKPEEFWLYGINKDEYKEKREFAKATKVAIEQALELGLIKNFDTLFVDDNNENKVAEQLLIAALKADLSYLLTNKK